MKYLPKPLFREKINSQLRDKADIEAFWDIIEKPLPKTIRCNTLKISPSELRRRLEEKGWKIKQPYKTNPEIMIISSSLQPGELGKSREHILGYYYVQETASMMPILALQPKPEEIFLDLCAAPGSKTSQASSSMDNKGTILANDPNLGRISVLSANLEKLGVSNTVMTRHDGVQLCKKLKKLGMKFDKILVDAPCGGEGNIRSNPATFKMWNPKLSEKLARTQKKLVESTIPLLKPEGILLYSTCTHAPEENEFVVQHLLKNHNLKTEPITLPLKTRPGITKFNKQNLLPELEKACRIYPQDNNTEGFFLCKMKKC